jgi:hypothetical protein
MIELFMPQSSSPTTNPPLAKFDLSDRLVVLARTLHAPAPETEAALKESVANWKRFGDTCLGQALYRHRSFFQNPSGSPAWSHTELTYFGSIVPEAVILELLHNKQPTNVRLLRSELLLTTPSSFLLPRDWRGMSDRPGMVASPEFIQVNHPYFEDYRSFVRDYCGPAAAKIVRSGRFGTFRAMETMAVLYRDPAAKVDWNQIHLCELNPDDFKGFGREFEAAMRDHGADRADTPRDFADLDRIRTLPRWTFNDPVIVMDAALVRAGRTEM